MLQAFLHFDAILVPSSGTGGEAALGRQCGSSPVRGKHKLLNGKLRYSGRE